MLNFRIVDGALVGFNANDLYTDETPVEFERNAPWIVVVGADEVHQVPTAGFPRRNIMGHSNEHYIDLFSAANEDGERFTCIHDQNDADDTKAHVFTGQSFIILGDPMTDESVLMVAHCANRQDAKNIDAAPYHYIKDTWKEWNRLQVYGIGIEGERVMPDDRFGTIFNHLPLAEGLRMNKLVEFAQGDDWYEVSFETLGLPRLEHRLRSSNWTIHQLVVLADGGVQLTLGRECERGSSVVLLQRTFNHEEAKTLLTML